MSSESCKIEMFLNRTDIFTVQIHQIIFAWFVGEKDKNLQLTA